MKYKKYQALLSRKKHTKNRIQRVCGMGVEVGARGKGGGVCVCVEGGGIDF